MSDKPPTGYTCDACDTFHEFPAYVFAHWNEALGHKCPCGQDWMIFQGDAIQEEKVDD